MSPATGTDTEPIHGSDAEELSSFGYRQELRRSLSFFSNFGVAFTYLSPVVGIYSLFALGVGTGGPRYVWTISDRRRRPAARVPRVRRARELVSARRRPVTPCTSSR